MNLLQDYLMEKTASGTGKLLRLVSKKMREYARAHGEDIPKFVPGSGMAPHDVNSLRQGLGSVDSPYTHGGRDVLTTHIVGVDRPTISLHSGEGSDMREILEGLPMLGRDIRTPLQITLHEGMHAFSEPTVSIEEYLKHNGRFADMSLKSPITDYWSRNFNKGQGLSKEGLKRVGEYDDKVTQSMKLRGSYAPKRQEGAETLADAGAMAVDKWLSETDPAMAQYMNTLANRMVYNPRKGYRQHRGRKTKGKYSFRPNDDRTLGFGLKRRLTNRGYGLKQNEAGQWMLMNIPTE